MLKFDDNIAHIGGWLTKEEGLFLYESAKRLSKEDVIIEIGSWKGRSTICFGMGTRDGNGAIIYAIDPHKGSSEHIKRFGRIDTYNEFLCNIKAAGIEKFVIPIKNTSEEAVKSFSQKVSFILVDGAHEYGFVKKDYNFWFPKIVNGGIIVFHDSWGAPGVHFLTALILFTSTKVRKPRLLDTITIMEKVERNSLVDRGYNILFVFYRLFVGWMGTIKMDNLSQGLKTLLLF